MGPASGHHIHCPLCGYDGNSYWHMICTGGHCSICGRPNSKNICEKCDAVVCDYHIEEHVYGINLCSKCMATMRGEKFRKPRHKQWDYSRCVCHACEMERKYRHMGVDIDSLVKKIAEFRSENVGEKG